MLVHQRRELPPRPVEVLDHVRQPGLTRPIRRRRGDDAEGGRAVLHRESEPRVELLIRIVRSDQLRGLQPRDVPRLRCARPRDRMRGRRLRHRRVGHERRPVVAQRGMDLIREHPPAVPLHDLSDRLELLPTDDRSGGVVRVAEHECPRPRGEGLVDALQVVLPAPVDLDTRHLDHRMPDRRQVCQERHVRRSRHDHGRTRRRILLHRDPESRHHIRHRMHPLRVDRPVVLVAHPLGRRLSQLRRLRGREVAEVLAVDRPVQRLRDLGSDPEVHLRHPRPDVAGMQTPLATLRPIEEETGTRIERMRRVRGTVRGHDLGSRRFSRRRRYRRGAGRGCRTREAPFTAGSDQSTDGPAPSHFTFPCVTAIPGGSSVGRSDGCRSRRRRVFLHPSPLPTSGASAARTPQGITAGQDGPGSDARWSPPRRT